MIARRHRQDALVAFAVGPVRHAAACSLTRRHFAALALVHPPHPQLLARLRIDGDDGAAHARLCVHDAIRHERGHLHVVVGPGTKVVGLEPPGDAQVLGVLFVDLIERGILGTTRARRRTSAIHRWSPRTVPTSTRRRRRATLRAQKPCAPSVTSRAVSVRGIIRRFRFRGPGFRSSGSQFWFPVPGLVPVPGSCYEEPGTGNWNAWNAELG